MNLDTKQRITFGQKSTHRILPQYHLEPTPLPWSVECHNDFSDRLWLFQVRIPLTLQSRTRHCVPIRRRRRNQWDKRKDQHNFGQYEGFSWEQNKSHHQMDISPFITWPKTESSPTKIEVWHKCKLFVNFAVCQGCQNAVNRSST